MDCHLSAGKGICPTFGAKNDCYPPGKTHSVVIQWLSYQNEKVRADRNDHGIHPTNSFYGHSDQNEIVQSNLRVKSSVGEDESVSEPQCA